MLFQKHGGSEGDKKWYWLLNRRSLSFQQAEKMTPTEARDRNEWLEKYGSKFLQYVDDLDKAIAEELAP